MFRRHYVMLAVLITSILTLPLYGDYLRSGALWLMVQKPAGCFSTIRTVINDDWMPPACADWRHCDLDDAKNIARGYTCGGQR